MGADGALRTDVLAALEQHGVDVTDVGAGRVQLSLGPVVFVQHFGATVSRSVIEGLIRKFAGLNMAAFYPPPGGKVH